MGRLVDGEDMIKGALALANQYEAHVDPWAFVISANIKRRHLGPKEKDELIARVLKVDPNRSDRAIAAQMRVDHHKVGNIRNDLMATGEISPVDKTVGADGKSRPAHPPARKPPSKEQQLRALRERSASHQPTMPLPPIVPERKRPTPHAAVPVPEPIKSMDEHDLDKALHRRRLSLGYALADSPKEALGIVVDLIGRLRVGEKLPRDQRIDFARGFVLALRLAPEDLGG
jgi:hypothetical protein